MEMEEIQELWAAHKKIGLDIADEAKKIPMTYDLFFKIYQIENKTYKRMEAAHKVLVRDTVSYYMGEMSSQEIRDSNRKPFPKRILKTDMKMYLDADEKIIESTLALDDQFCKVEYLKDNVLKNLSNRGFQLSQSMDWLKFTHGQA